MSLSKVQISAIVVVIIIIVAACAVVVVSGDDDDDDDVSDVSIDSYSSDPVLWIYGNADGDEDIDADDVAIIQAVIDAGGSASSYEWCDANADGKINESDIEQVESMIDGTATTLYYLNIDDNVCSYTVRENVYIIAVNKCQAEDVLILINTSYDENYIVGGDQQVYKYNNELQLNFGDDASAGEVLATGTSNGEVQAEIVSELVSVYGHVEIAIGSSSSYGTNLETNFGSDEDVSIIRLPSWEDGTLSGVMTYGYLFGGVQQNSCWDQALLYYDWYMSYYQAIVDEVATIADEDKPNLLITYVTDCYPGATNKVLSSTSGDYERSIEAGANNIGEYFGTGYVAFTAEDMAACEAELGIDIIIVEPSAVYDSDYEGDGYDGVVNAIDLAIAELDGYISTETKIYSLSFMLSAGPGCVVSYVFYAQVCYPDNSVFAQFDANEVFQEYLALIGWDDRDDVSSICCYGPGYTTTAL